MPSGVIQRTLISGLDRLPPGALVVGFSGGLDSTVLLHALASLPAARRRGLRAVHVDHRLHANSATWADHAARTAADIAVPLEIVAAGEIRPAGTGLEGAARKQRHDCFRETLRGGELLVLAHHADDQAETVLLKLLRGAGPEGLGGMRRLRTFGRGHLWRPFLDLPRTQLRAYAVAHALSWIDDPSNEDTRLRRNFLRCEIVPRLAQHWPEASAAIAHSARWSRAAADFIAQQSQLALAHLQGVDPATIAWAGWLALPDALRDPVLRRWLRGLGFEEPAHFQVGEVERQLGEAGEDAAPCVRWGNCEVRRYRDLLHAMCPLTPIDPAWQADWNDRAVELPDGGTLAWESGDGAWPCATAAWPALVVRFRHGGERIRLSGDAHTRELRTLLQEHGIPPWQRDRIPLVYDGDALIAAGDLFASAPARALAERLGARIAWRTARAPA